MKQKHLTFEERESIEDMLKDNFNLTQIGEKIAKHRTTISKEILNHQFKNGFWIVNTFLDKIYKDNCNL